MVQCGKQLLKSEVMQKGGKIPVWNKVFELDIIDEKEIEFEVYDEDETENELIGKKTIPVSDLIKQEG